MRKEISAARQEWERDTATRTVSRTITEQLSHWPVAGYRLYYRPVESVTSITYYDSSNNQQTLDPTQYSLDAFNRQIYPAYGVTWPSTSTRWDAVTIIYVAGSNIPTETSKRAMFLLIDYYFENRNEPIDKEKVRNAYELLVRKHMRPSYP